MQRLGHRDRGVISVYALGRDYHEVLKGKLKQLAGWLSRTTQAQVKVFVDTAPLLEKPLAAKAGIGWQGKHTNLVSRDHGSWTFLGAMLTTLPLAPDPPHEDHCGRCRACLDICPTAAFPEPYRLDPRRCISYLTIEHKGHIAREFRKAMGNRIYGCDDCLAVCPWNKFAADRRRSEDQGPGGSRPAGARGAGGARRCGLSSPVRRLAGEADGTRPFRAQCADCDRQFQRAAARRHRRAARRRPLAAGPGDGRLGAVAAVLARALSGAAPGHSWPARPTRRCAPNGGAAVEAPLLRAWLCRDRAGAGAGAARLRHRRDAPQRRRDGGAGPCRRRSLPFDGTRPIAAAALDGVEPSARFDPARRPGRSGPQASSRRAGGAGTAVRLGRLSVDDRRLWRSGGRLGRRDRPARAGDGARPAPGGGRGGMARASGKRRPAGPYFSPRRHLRAGAQPARRDARRHGAAHRQAGPGLLPGACRRHCRNSDSLDGAATAGGGLQCLR